MTWTGRALLPLLFFAHPGPFDAGRYLAHIQFLSSPELKGRATGSPELDAAARYIEAQFRAAGLEPPPGARGYRQSFAVTTAAKPGRGNRLEFTWGQETQTLTFGKEFMPFHFSGTGKASGGAVFAGYGITAPEYGYDDYAGLDARGKFVVVFMHEPQEYDPRSVFEGKVYTIHAQLYAKALNAKAHGARGVILLEDRANHRAGSGDLEPFGEGSGPGDAGIPFVEVKEEAIDDWFRAAGTDPESLATAINGDLKPRSFSFRGVEVRENIAIERGAGTADNVAGWLPGETDEYVVIGAHYDHLGLGERFSMAPSAAGKVHPGADDNASGTAAMIELARSFAAGPKPRRSLLFIAFAGEELGLLGSEYYVDHPEAPLREASAMVNLDMIGRIRNGKVYVGGAAAEGRYRQELNEIAARRGLKPDYSDADYGSSDHVAFAAKGIPVLFLFSGLHEDYHRPGDTWDKINVAGALQVMGLVREWVAAL